ncbi:MAG: molybdate ABC transporter substrate-binding protein [Rhodococcus sp. (in: high G+C Gram-positive bacteria)]
MLKIALASCCALALLATGCSPRGTADSQTVTVFAAASLQSTFTEIGEKFEQSHPGSTVRFTFAGSSDLAAQLTQGAPGDVFAAADTANMSKVVDADLIDGTAVDFASNTLTIVTPPGNPAGIGSFADLTKPGVDVVVCAPQVPCGAAAEKIETAAGVALSPVSEESSVTDVLGKVTSGQADAGLVYVTDASGAGDTVTAIPFPESSGAVNTYPIAMVRGSQASDLAREFLQTVTGPDGQSVLAAAGFAAP